jgi:hypothetical protein
MNKKQALLRILANAIIVVFFSAGIVFLSLNLTGVQHWLVFAAAIFSSILFLPQILDDTKMAINTFKPEETI